MGENDRDDGEQRLKRALSAIGVKGGEPSHHVYGLLEEIHRFAVMHHDADMEESTQTAMEKIRAANAVVV